VAFEMQRELAVPEKERAIMDKGDSASALVLQDQPAHANA